jgi:hypothetical protein
LLPLPTVAADMAAAADIWAVVAVHTLGAEVLTLAVRVWAAAVFAVAAWQLHAASAE